MGPVIWSAVGAGRTVVVGVAAAVVGVAAAWACSGINDAPTANTAMAAAFPSHDLVVRFILLPLFNLCPMSERNFPAIEATVL